VADYVRNKIQKRLYLSNVMPTITYLVKKSDLGLYRVDDFWTPQYTEVLDTIEGRPISPSTFTLYRYDENDENKARKVKFREFFSNSEEALTIFPDDMSTASLVLDPSTPKTMMFKEICDRETPYTDWKPTHKITIYHPENDEQVPYFLALDAFNALKYTNGGGDNVQLKTFQIPTPSSIEVSPHYVGTALAQFKMLVNKDPSVVADTDLLNQLINRIFNAI